MVLIDANAILRYVLNDNFEMAQSAKELLKNKITLFEAWKFDFVDTVLYAKNRVYGYDVFTFDKKLNTLLRSQITEG